MVASTVVVAGSVGVSAVVGLVLEDRVTVVVSVVVSVAVTVNGAATLSDDPQAEARSVDVVAREISAPRLIFRRFIAARSSLPGVRQICAVSLGNLCLFFDNPAGEEGSTQMCVSSSEWVTRGPNCR